MIVLWGEQPPFIPSVCGAVIFDSEIGCVRIAIPQPTEVVSRNVRSIVPIVGANLDGTVAAMDCYDHQ